MEVWHRSEETGRVSTDGFGPFSWAQVEPTSIREGIFIILREDIEQYEELGYQVMEFETCAVAY